MIQKSLIMIMGGDCPAFDFLDFLPGSYQDSSGSLDIPTRNPSTILQEYGRLSRKFRIPIRKIRNPGDQPGNPGIIFRMLSDIFQGLSRFSMTMQDLSGLLLKVLNLQFLRFCRNFPDALRDFPGFFKVKVF